MGAEFWERKIGWRDFERGNFREQIGAVVERHRLVRLASRQNDARKTYRNCASHVDISGHGWGEMAGGLDFLMLLPELSEQQDYHRAWRAGLPGVYHSGS